MTPKTKNLILLWSVAFVRLMVKSVITVGTTLQLATYNTPLSKMDADEIYLLKWGIVVMVGSHIESFLTNTIKQIKSGNDQPPDDDDPPPAGPVTRKEVSTKTIVDTPPVVAVASVKPLEVPAEPKV